DNMHLLARTGRWLGGTPPTGYQGAEEWEIILDGKVKTFHKLVFSDEIETVKLMYHHFLETHSVSAVSKYLIAKKMKSKATGKYFSVLGIRDILQNPVYCIADEIACNYFIQNGSEICCDKELWNGEYGVSVYNKRDYSRSGAPRNPLEEWTVAIGKHKGIISGKDWVSIQTYFHDNSREKVVNHSEVGLLSGLIYCTKCGEKMFSKKHKAKSETFSYICSSKLKGGNALCKGLNLTGKQTDALVIDYIKAEFDKYDTFTPALETLKMDYEKEQKNNQTGKIKKEIESVQSEINVLVNRLTDVSLSQISLEAVDKRIVAQTEHLKMLQSKLKKQTEKNNIDEAEIMESCKSFKDLFDCLSVYDKRQIIRLFIKKMEWDGRVLTIYMYSK
ncbi:MAG: recombinase family protein, partial [Eubacterium sp.]|nr:recombinase family protein [Eubacterium sp.]